jgi:hypothetical protein
LLLKLCIPTIHEEVEEAEERTKKKLADGLARTNIYFYSQFFIPRTLNLDDDSIKNDDI